MKFTEKLPHFLPFKGFDLTNMQYLSFNFKSCFLIFLQRAIKKEFMKNSFMKKDHIDFTSC